MPPDNIFDRQIFGDLSQFDTTCAFVRSIIEPTIDIVDFVVATLAATVNIIFTTRIKKILDSTTRIRKTLDSTTRIRKALDSTTRIRKTLDSTTRIKDKEDKSI